MSSIKTRLLLRVLAAIVGGMTMLIVSYVGFVRLLERDIVAEAERVLDEQLQQTSDLVTDLVETHGAAIAAELDADLVLALHEIADRGGSRLDYDRVRRWRVVDPAGDQTQELDLPAMTVGGIPVGMSYRLSDDVPLVDEIGALTGTEVTLFQRMSDEGDMLRVATTVVDVGAGRRAVGTTHPAALATGQPDPVIRAVFAGETWQGIERVGDEAHIAAYHPLLDGDRVVGMVRVAAPERQLASVHEAIDAVRIGATGYATVVRGTGERVGHVAGVGARRAAPPSLLELAASDDARDRLGGMLVDAVEHGAATLDRVRLYDRDGSIPRYATLRATRYAAWDWVVVTVAWDDEVGAYQAFLSDASRTLIVRLCLILVAAAIATVLAMVVFSRRLVGRIESVSAAAEALAHGQRHDVADDDSGDEVGRLTRAVHALHIYLSHLADASSAVARGQFDVHVDPRSDEDRLSMSFSSMVDNLRTTVGELRSRTDWQAFQEGIGQAMSMALDEHEAFTVLDRSVERELPAHHVELLIADASHANLESVLPVPSGLGCDVTSPMQCPAIRDGATRHFARACDYTSCPHAWSRGEAALTCVPVRVAGRAVGVLHAIRPPNAHVEDPEAARRRMEELARRIGDRIGVIRAFEQSETRASTDPLTGLLNRRSVENSASLLRARGESYAVLFADLDHFKRLNDRHGHEMGDRALRLFARVLAEHGREADVRGRWGGEEFVMLLPRTRASGAARVADELRAQLHAAIGEAITPSFTVSIGVADTAGNEPLSDVLARADAALYRAKEDGRDRVIAFDPSSMGAGHKQQHHPTPSAIRPVPLTSDPPASPGDIDDVEASA